MSNMRLARQINVDASHISRFRSGVRSPRSNAILSELLAEALIKRAAEQNRIQSISKLASISADVLTDEEEGLTAFSGWLYDISAEPDTSDIDRLLDCIDSFSPDNRVSLPELPFTDIQIIKSGDRVTVIRSRQPYAAFVFTEPMMLRAFDGYFEVLKNRYRCDRSAVRRMLRRFL